MKPFVSGLIALAFIGCLIVPIAHAQSAPDSTSTTTTTTEKKEEPGEKSNTIVKTEKAMKKIVKVDVNSAEKEDLLEVKGIDDATADKIIAGRPYTSKAQLKSKGIVDAKTYKMISSHIVVKKPKKMASKTS
jgi:DNA uptake protein ComE-like DNA-binding protein